MPFDAPREPDRPERRGPREHVWAVTRDVCEFCGLTGEAYLHFPETPCEPVAAAQAMAALDRRKARARVAGTYRRGPLNDG